MQILLGYTSAEVTRSITSAEVSSESRAAVRNWRLDPNGAWDKKVPSSSEVKAWDLDGRGERIRTSDPLVPNQVRYQTALRPEQWIR